MVVFITQNERFASSMYAAFSQLGCERAANELVAIKKYPSARVLIAHECDCSAIETLIDAGFAVLVVADEPDYSQAVSLLALGARGYANTHMYDRHFKDAAACISSGGMWLLPEFMAQMAAAVASSVGSVQFSAAHNARKLLENSSLNEREKTVANMVIQGNTNAAIAEHMGLSLRTIKSVCAQIYQKCGAKSRVEFIHLARG